MSARKKRRAWRLGEVLVWLSFAVLAAVAACALAPGWIALYSPTEMHGDAVLKAPGAAHWFGTDQFGRDVFSLVVHGARQSLLIGLAAVLVGCACGVSLGILAGYAGGWFDALAMRFIDVWMAIPNLLLAIALATALPPSLLNTVLAISIASVPRYTRVLRGQALTIRHRAFVEAARTAGASHFAILRGHILPHCVAPILVMATLGIGGAILAGSSLSFLGLGVNDESPDWGYLLTQGRGYLTVAWWIVTFPGLAITALVIAVNLLGDALRRRLDPRQRLK
ncbi:ABC transporter permease [Xylophilus sp.]|uniref:ABC transporter permease n=1 Tax=Xylophilus sp. TaxID=2653893 RepID=UPI002D805526|nr:ABC transporter permease [Xylophilus sp.]